MTEELTFAYLISEPKGVMKREFTCVDCGDTFSLGEEWFEDYLEDYGKEYFLRCSKCCPLV